VAQGMERPPGPDSGVGPVEHHLGGVVVLTSSADLLMRLWEGSQMKVASDAS
jgi:hypothetical protein